MASLQVIVSAVRVKYGPYDSSIKLSELLFFLDSLQDSPSAPGHAAQGQKQQSLKGFSAANKSGPVHQPPVQAMPQAKPQAKPPRPTADHRDTRVATAPRSGQALGDKPTNQEKAGHRPGILAPLSNPKRPRTFAEVVKGTKGTQPQKPYLPSRLGEQKTTIANPLRVYYSNPQALEASPEAILGKITSQQQKLAIRGVKKIS